MLTTVVLVLVSAVAAAHHSRAAYDTDTVTVVEGELIDVRWRNPHIVFTLKVSGEDGNEVLWRMEAGSIYMLKRSGLDEKLFGTGVTVKVAGYLSKHEQRDFLATSMLMPDGQEIMTMPNATAHWSDDRLGGQDQWVADDERLADAGSSEMGIFQVWSIPQRSRRRSDLPFTEAALAARAAWNMVDNPMTRCEQPGMPRVMLNPHPFQFIDEGDRIRLLGEEWDVVRYIHMNAAADPLGQAPSRFGYSVGRWDDNTLVVETTGINWPWFDGLGTPQSDAVTISERFTLSEDQRRLDYRITIDDPVYLTRPGTVDVYWLALGESVEPFECEVF